MKHRFEKNLHIANNLISYCHELGSTEFLVDIKMLPDATVFEIQCPLGHIDEEEFNNISEALNRGRQHEVEQNFWEIGGDFEPQSDLLFTGMMVNEAEVRYEDGKLCITAKRLED